MSQRFIKPTSVLDVLGVIGYKKPTPPVPSVAPLRLTCTIAPLWISFVPYGDIDVWYKINDGNWIEGGLLDWNLDVDDYVEVRAVKNDTGTIGRFSMDGTSAGRVVASGSIMSLIYGESLDEDNNLVIPDSIMFYSLFSGCTNLITPPELPATTLSPGCYNSLFMSTGLTTAPVLPAENMNLSCYWYMFAGCTSLSIAPELPSKHLANQCYQQMFAGCTSLIIAPDLPAETLTFRCYLQMFSGCTSLEQAPIIGATTTAEHACNRMFDQCTSLRIAPELHAIDLTSDCYAGMFISCSGLEYLKVAFTDWNFDNNSTLYWLASASAVGTFVCPAALDTSIRDSSHVPAGWTVETY